MSIWKANRLRVLRAERRVTQRDLARRIRVSQSMVSLWESAVLEPDDRTKKKLAKALKVDVVALLPVSAEAMAS